MAITAQDAEVMRAVEEFQKFCHQHTANTENVRTHKKLGTGVYRVPAEVKGKIGCIISLLQDKINQGFFCGEDEYVMIHNLQLGVLDSFYTLEMFRIAKEEAGDLNAPSQEAYFELVIDQEGNITNASAALEELGYFDEEEEAEPPIYYGNYHDYSEPQPFLAERLMSLKSRLADVSCSAEVKGAKEIENFKSILTPIFASLKSAEKMSHIPALMVERGPENSLAIDQNETCSPIISPTNSSTDSPTNSSTTDYILATAAR